MQSIKRRIRAVKNTGQITKAMEMVSANKMRRSQETALSSRPYALAALELLMELERRVEARPRLMEVRPVSKTLVILVAADKGLAGSLNSNIFRKFEKEFHDIKAGGETFFAAVGKKSHEFLMRRGFGSVKSFTNFGDYIETEETKPFSDFIIHGFMSGDWDRVLILSTHFRSTLRQDVLLRELLPVSEEKIKKTIRELVPERGRYSEAGGKVPEENEPHQSWEYLIEPSALLVLESLVIHLVEMTVYDLILEANASEHSARMVAMKNASDNASELEGDLTLLYNKSRQTGITREISEITAGAESLKQ